MNALQLWAGPECTFNRVGSTWRDQSDETGFANRLDDLDRLCDLGIRHIRFPLLWERTEGPGGALNWEWADARMERLRRLGMSCIATLVHHGSGPARTSLTDPGFAEGLAEFAGAVATRYPHIEQYTPVNEPVTTARFSGLYGVWFPHGRDDRSFVRCILNQVNAVRLSMAAIRRVSPAAALVQTDDVGFTQSAPALRYQADFDNHRRWLGFDLLAGKVDASHPLWGYLCGNGASEAELAGFAATPCPPDVVGVNYYVTSERYLDDRLALHAEATHGGNGRHRYVDVETVRVMGPRLSGSEARLREAWLRYRIPVALTEVHLGCTREEQLRWLHEAWQGALAARADGAGVQAVTAWAAFGTVDWDSLITRRSGHYEPGMWDVRAALPRPTALATLVAELASGKAPSSPVLSGPGWWHRGLRHLYPVVGERQAVPIVGRPILICGDAQTLAGAFARLCRMRGLPYRLLATDDMNLDDSHSVDHALDRWAPWAVIDATSLRSGGLGSAQPLAPCALPNGPATLARATHKRGIRLASFSSADVFQRGLPADRNESDAVSPDSPQGDLQAEVDRQVMLNDPTALIARSAGWFCAWDRDNDLARSLDALQRGETVEACGTHAVSLTYVRDLAMSTLDLLVDGEQGVWHLANRGAVSWHRCLLKAAELAGLDASRLVRTDAPTGTGTPAVLTSERGGTMPSLVDALQRYAVERDPRREAPDQTHRAPRPAEPWH